MQKQHPEPESIFSAAKLPPLPQTLVKLLDACSDSEADITEVAAIVANDVIIAAKILKLANSAFLGARSTFLTIEQAVIYLGIDTVRNLAISVSVHETFSDLPESKYFRLPEFWHHSLLTALLAKEIADQVQYEDPAQAYLAGLLHDIGKCLFNSVFTQKYDSLLQDTTQAADIAAKERAMFNLTHEDAGARLMKYWKMHPDLTEAIARHHSTAPPASLPLLSQIVRLANALSTCESGQIHPGQLQPLSTDPAKIHELVAAQRERVVLVAESLGIHITEPEQRPNDSTPASTKAQLKADLEQITLLTGVLDNLVRANTPNRIHLVLEESLQILYGIEKSCLLIEEPGSSNFSTAGSFRNKIAHQLKKETLSFPPGSPLESCRKSRSITHIISSECDPADKSLRLLFDTFAEHSLELVCFPISNVQNAILVFALDTANVRAMADRAQTYLLLLSHIGNRLQLEQLQKQHAREQVQHHIKAMEEISRTIAHEISGPLNIIQNYLALLKSRNEFPENTQHEINIIDKEIDRIASICNQLHDLSKKPAVPARVKTDIVSLIQGVIRLFQKSLTPESPIRIEFKGDETVEPIWSIPDALQQILVNLLTNSLEAIGASGHIFLAVEYPHSATSVARNEIMIKVTDSGPGIAPHIADKVFQAGCTTKENNHSGLGLAIVRKLVNDLAGKILYQRNSSRETEFIIYLPTDFRK